MSNSINTVCVIGAGTMGSGIAQTCAQNGFNTLLFDINAAALDKAKNAVEKNLQYLVDKQKLSEADRQTVLSRLTFTGSINDCVAGIIIEAVAEKMDVKNAIFKQLAAINGADVLFASNTSSLSISDLQKNIQHPQRVAGMHFFNPAPVMKLVEVVKGIATSGETIHAVMELCRQLNKVPVVCSDAPGFIVNRVARHYYLEAMKLVEQGAATIETVDAVMEATGFKMGPFKLMDLIGMDVNLAVSKSIYEAFGNEERFKPSSLQEDKVIKGELGKKSGKGFYTYNS